MAAEHVIVAYTPTDARDRLAGEFGPASDWIPQRGCDLGERMDDVISESVRKGCGPVVIIGTDSPTFPSECIAQSFELLKTEADVVLGPTEDGGYYLIGAGSHFTGLFAEVPWSTRIAGAKTIGNAKALGLTVRTIGSWYDVDEPADLLRLDREVRSDPGAARRIAPCTRDWLYLNREFTRSIVQDRRG